MIDTPYTIQAGHKNLFGFLLIFLGISIGNVASAQYVIVNGSDTVLNYADSISLSIENPDGSIQWQTSRNLRDWKELKGETRTDLHLKIDSNAYYRAKIIDGTCDPVFSDTTLVIKYYSNETVDSLDTFNDLEINRILLDTTDIVYEIARIDSTSQSFPVYYLSTSSDISMIEVGDIIIDNLGNNTAYRVIDIQENTLKKGTNGKFLTAIASGFDFLFPNKEYRITTPTNRAKQNAEYQYKLDETPSPIGLSNTVSTPIKVNLQGMSHSFDDESITFTFEDTPLEEYGDGNLTFKINSGYIKYFPAFDVRYKTKREFIGDVNLLQEVTSVVSGPSFTSLLTDMDFITYHDVDFELDVTISANADLSETIPFTIADAIFLIPMGQALFATMNVELIGNLTASMSADARLDFNVSSENDFILGFEKNLQRGKRNIVDEFRTNTSLTREDPYLSLKYGAVLEITPRVEIYYLGCFGYAAELAAFGLQQRVEIH